MRRGTVVSYRVVPGRPAAYARGRTPVQEPSLPTPPEAPGTNRPPARTGRGAWTATLLAVAIAFGAVVSLTWPLLVAPGSTLPRSSFGPSFAWSLRVVPDALASGDLLLRTREAGWPWLRDARFLGWVPLIAGSLLRLVTSPVAAFNLLMLAAPPLGALSGALWVRRFSPSVRPASLLLAALTYACSVHALANVANGELAKAWSFLVPLSLLALDAASRSWRWTPLLALASVAVVFTDPYAFFCVALAAPFVVARRPARGDLARIAACGALLLAAAWTGGLYYQPPHDAWTSLFAPSNAPMAARERLGAPYSSAPLLALVRPPWEDVPSGTQHGVYLTWTVLGLGLAGAVQAWRSDRRGLARALALAATGLVSCLGPWLFLSPSRPAVVPLPALVLEHVMPDRWGGMYYRFVHVGLLGLALLVARVRLPALAALPVLVAFGAEVRLSARQGWPLPLEAPPPAGILAEMASDPVPGAVLLLPAYPEGESVSAGAFTLAAFHGRPMTALPRRPSFPAEYAPHGAWLDRCAEGGDCRVPPTLEADLEAQGVRYVVLRIGKPFRTHRLLRLLGDMLGEPRSAGGLAWWVLDAAAPDAVAARHPGAPESPPGPRVLPPRR